MRGQGANIGSSGSFRRQNIVDHDMEPELKVHSYDKNKASDPASIPELTDWLTSTATLQVPELEAKVKQFHYVECSDHQRLELLDWIRPLLSNTAYAVRATIADGKLPLPDHVLTHIDGLGRVYAIMADLYKGTIMSLASRVLQNAEDSQKSRKVLHEDLILACYGAIHFLAGQLRTIYEGYKPTPDGIWHEIHHIYNYSRFILDISCNSGINEEKIRDEFFLIEHIYKRSLLLGLCNPYHFPVVAFGELNRTLNKWAHLCKLERNIRSVEQRCMFSVDTESDYPAVPVLSHSGDLATSDRFSVLCTKALVNALKHEVDSMAHEAFEGPTKDVSEKDMHRLEMYRRLIMNWGKHPVRQDARHDREGRCEAVAGYSQIMKKMGGMLVTAIKKDPLNDQLCSTIIDASEMGYQVEMHTDSDTRFNIGDMIAIRDEKHLDQWSLAIVRWARYTTRKYIRAGTFIMGWQAERYRLQMELSSDQTIDVMSVSGTSNFPSGKKILLVPCGIYRPGRIMELIGGESHRIVARNLIMSGSDFDVIDYKLLN
ncbi:hypothetical protein BMS3Bbin11_01733 [bacterium BMS3Bbin11]|nr:hypothetical protein BMS3Abin11_02396 [bacterium BMS3Abin11]GBE46632.1 hypothetical protein BMS3Bbin11_01733 [bacterium BMS3Bbin11]GMT40043.1 MAG: hypothetical protein IEMM0001_0778 [bacterium]HDH17028.1 hypothetical protein [Gammaproteobacteria bacterium]HDZ79572.1 hypothetical protein [Gammaproteobacteria bacterium]